MEPKMTNETFNNWLADMKSAGLARSDAECARLLGISANSVVTMKKNGADLRTALACRALLHRMEPYA
jgi:DNA-binding CsgD family transcriptional regulator